MVGVAVSAWPNRRSRTNRKIRTGRKQRLELSHPFRTCLENAVGQASRLPVWRLALVFSRARRPLIAGRRPAPLFFSRALSFKEFAAFISIGHESYLWQLAGLAFAAQMDEGLGSADAGFAPAPGRDNFMVLAPDALAVLADVREQGGFFLLDH